MGHLHFSEETLMAYADGELETATAAAVEEAMTRDPALLPRIAGHIRSRRLARAAFATDIFAWEPPEDLVRSVEGRVGGSAEKAARPSLVTPARPFLDKLRRLPAAAAILVSAALGLQLAVQTRQAAEPAQGVVTALVDPALHGALSGVRTGQEAGLSDGVFRAISTFVVEDGRLCREFVVSAASEDTMDAVACRSDASWQVTFALASERQTDYVPAGDDGILEAYLNDIGAGAPLSDEAEAQALDL